MLRKVLALLMLLLAVWSPTASARPPQALDFLHVAGSQIVDEAGRTVILRGANANGLVD